MDFGLWQLALYCLYSLNPGRGLVVETFAVPGPVPTLRSNPGAVGFKTPPKIRVCWGPYTSSLGKYLYMLTTTTRKQCARCWQPDPAPSRVNMHYLSRSQTLNSEGPSTGMVYTWALKKLLYPCFRVYVCAIYIYICRYLDPSSNLPKKSATSAIQYIAHRYINIHTHTYTHAQIYVYIIHIYIYTYVYTHTIYIIHICVYIYIYIHVCLYTYLQAPEGLGASTTFCGQRAPQGRP